MNSPGQYGSPGASQEKKVRLLFLFFGYTEKTQGISDALNIFILLLIL